MNEIEVSPEFIEDSRKLCQTMSNPRRGGRYSKQESEVRRNEVYRLHFDYGYSARKIAQLMKVNKNTINEDVKYWYSKIVSNCTYILDPAHSVVITLERFESQRSRLREELDKVQDFNERILIERLICDIDSRIIQIYQKLSESSYRIQKSSIDFVNKHLEKCKIDDRFMTFASTISVSNKTYQKIRTLLNKEREGDSK